MITKIRKYQDSWLTKAILALTALSFMSLFGISGYVSRAGKNRAVIKVDNLEILQDEMNNKLQNSIRKSTHLFGSDVEINDEIRKNILSSLVRQNANDMIIARQAQKSGVEISDELIERIIADQPEFMDASGHFSPTILHRQLAYFDTTESEYIAGLRQDVMTRHIVNSPVEKVTFPQFMNRYIAKIQNQQKVFQYVTIDPSVMQIDRDITDEEIEQYYQDFAPQFEEPEARDVAFIELKTAQLAASLAVSDEDIRAYYQDNLTDYVTPEKRRILQMVFDDEQAAIDAINDLDKGQDFYKVASSHAHQDKETTFLGDLTEDSLLPELAEAAFDLKSGQTTSPIKTEFGWHVLKVTNIIPKVETPLESVRAKITQAIKNEQAYDQAAEIINSIEDEIGTGTLLEDIAKKYNSPLVTVQGLRENGAFDSLSRRSLSGVVALPDFIETAFSYNENEVSQTIETDEGFVFAEVKKIHNAHIKDLAKVKPEIIKIWTENEKSAIAQELVGNIMTDMEGGDSLEDIAARFNLKLKTTPPLKRGETFGNLNSAQAAEAYQTAVGSFQNLSSGGVTTIVTPTKVINSSGSVSEAQLQKIGADMNREMEQNMAEELINSYARDMDVRIKYKLMGLEE
ncbi:MAG: peptidyl-prolyl cis-trans isomerase [Alphaproteobacteria bacterium]|nr:peptidyl-prolyl cis-trans isomerase [Alphaproteobacteria bacterium]